MTDEKEAVESKRRIHVVAGVVEAADGRILITQRPVEAHQGGYWEFPGGKVEPGESAVHALEREMAEEVLLAVVETEPMMQVRHDYPDKSILLDVYRVTDYYGDARANEGQPLRWVTPEQLRDYRFPAANRGIVSTLTLPDRILITGPAEPLEDYLARLEAALARGIPIVQLRCPELSREEYMALAPRAAQLCRAHSALLMLNTSPETYMALGLEDCGLHLNSRRLMASRERPVPESVLLSASCHNAEEIQRSSQLAVDFLTLSPIAPTPGHGKVRSLGWTKFTRLLEHASAPVFALGGMDPTLIANARIAGGHGIAGIRYAW